VTGVQLTPSLHSGTYGGSVYDDDDDDDEGAALKPEKHNSSHVDFQEDSSEAKTIETSNSTLRCHFICSSPLYSRNRLGHLCISHLFERRAPVSICGF
jgi:hypothetical protein